MRVFPKMKREWKQYLFERRTTQSEEKGQKETQGEGEKKGKKGKKEKESVTLRDVNVMKVMAEGDQGEGEEEEGKKKNGKGPSPLPKKSRFISKSERGSFWKYRPQDDRRFGLNKDT
jgi:hypothetical protein